MTREHARWDEFCARLHGPEGCDFRKDENGERRFTCDGDGGPTFELPEKVHRLSRAILMQMGLSDEEIAASLVYFAEHGGYCDCEVLWNVARINDRAA